MTAVVVVVVVVLVLVLVLMFIGLKRDLAKLRAEWGELSAEVEVELRDIEAILDRME